MLIFVDELRNSRLRLGALFLGKLLLNLLEQRIGLVGLLQVTKEVEDVSLVLLSVIEEQKLEQFLELLFLGVFGLVGFLEVQKRPGNWTRFFRCILRFYYVH